MDDHVVAICLALVLGGLATALGASLARRGALETRAAAHGEVASWRRLWLPLIPSPVVWSLFAGWALQEPDLADERLHLAWFWAAGMCLLVVLRAAVRALRSAASRRTEVAATVGLLRPRIVISRDLLARLDGSARRAVLEHERAHARHRDPLRILVGHLAADLQWPLPGTRRRLSEWRHALELARDEEARRRGVPGADLAHAILETAKMQQAVAGAGLTGDGARLRHRIAKLLAPLPDCDAEPRGVWGLAHLAPFLLASATVGAAFGNQIIHALPGVTW